MSQKIMINIFCFPNEHGGTEIRTHQLALNLSKMGRIIYLVTGYEGNSPSIEFKDTTYYIYRIHRSKTPLIGPLLYFLSIFSLALKLKPDVILDQGLHGYGLLTRIVTRKPYIVWGRGSDVYSIRSYFHKLFIKLVLKNASLALALSEDMKNHMMQILNRKVFVIPNGININKFRRKMNLSSEKRYSEKQLLFIGNVRPVKGVKYLLDAMPAIIEKEPQTCLVIVGAHASELKKIIPKNLRKKIILTGFVNHEQILAFLKGSDIFVLPSLSEGFPNVLLEAMLAGLPVVATNVGGVPELIRNGENGFLVQAKKSEEITEKVLILLKNSDLCENFKLNNQLKIVGYDESRIFLKLEEIMSRVI